MVKKMIAAAYRYGFLLVCTAVLIFLFGDTLAGETAGISTVRNWTFGLGATLLMMASLADAVGYRAQLQPTPGP